MRSIFPVLAAPLAILAAPAAAVQDTEATAILFHGAIRDGDLAAVRAFLDRGVNVNLLNSGGFSPLMTAANEGRLEIVRLLLQRGADPTIKNSSGWDAAFLADLNRHPDVVALLRGTTAAAPAAPAPAPAPSVRPAPAPAPAPAPVAPRAPASPTQWPALGQHRVGETVLYSGTAGKTWERGLIRSIDPTYGYDIEGVSGSFDPNFVTSLERQPYWTGYFVGDWRISVPMATNLYTDGRNVYRSFSGGMRLPPLRVNGDGTYSWRVLENSGQERLVQGRWRPNPEGPGIILERGDKGADWLMYNNTRRDSILGETVILSSDQHTYQDGTRISP